MHNEGGNDASSVAVTNSRRSRLLFALIGVAGGLLIATAICFALFLTGGVIAWRNFADVENVLSSYMQAMAERDIYTAYALLSEQTQRVTSVTDFKFYLEGEQYEFYRGYTSLSNLSVTSTVRAAADHDSATEFATVRATVNYADGSSALLTAKLAKIQTTWRIVDVIVERNPDPIPSLAPPTVLPLPTGDTL